MQQIFHDRYGEPRIQFRLAHLLWAMVWVAIVSVLLDSAWLASGVGSLLIIAYLHSRSLGRTTPLASFAFVGFLAISSLASIFPYMAMEIQGKNSIPNVAEDEIQHLILAVVCASLVAACVVAIVTAVIKREEWFNHL